MTASAVKLALWDRRALRWELPDQSSYGRQRHGQSDHSTGAVYLDRCASCERRCSLALPSSRHSSERGRPRPRLPRLAGLKKSAGDTPSTFARRVSVTIVRFAPLSYRCA